MKKSLLCGDKLKPALRVLGLMLALSAMDTRADAIKWTLRDATFDDGGIAFGSFVFDDDTKMYSEVSITTTAGTSHGGDTYEHRSELSVSSRDRLILVDDPVCDLLDQHVLSLFFAVPQLTNAGGQVDLIILPGPTAGSRENLRQTCDGSSTGIRGLTGGFVTSQLLVDIDIKPGGDTNPLNPKSKGIIRVAILGSVNFDATQVDSSTVVFGPSEAAPVNDVRVTNINHDAFEDVVFHFRANALGIACGDTAATLSAETFGGVSITGTDSVQIVGCK